MKTEDEFKKAFAKELVEFVYTAFRNGDGVNKDWRGAQCQAAMNSVDSLMGKMYHFIADVKPVLPEPVLPPTIPEAIEAAMKRIETAGVEEQDEAVVASRPFFELCRQIKAARPKPETNGKEVKP